MPKLASAQQGSAKDTLPLPGNPDSCRHNSFCTSSKYAEQKCETAHFNRLHLAMAEVQRDQSSWVRLTNYLAQERRHLVFTVAFWAYLCNIIKIQEDDAMLKKTAERSQGLQAAAADSAAAASKAARATEPESAEAVVAASQLELAAYASGVLCYLAEGRDFEALDLSQHVRLHTFQLFS